MIRIQNELLALEVFAEMIHAPDSGGGFQKERGIIFLVILELARGE
jgi:hypothetical protein